MTETAETGTGNQSTPCCKYVFNIGDAGPIFWNGFNGVVQCHNCGQVFVEKRWPWWRTNYRAVNFVLWMRKHLPFDTVLKAFAITSIVLGVIWLTWAAVYVGRVLERMH